MAIALIGVPRGLRAIILPLGFLALVLVALTIYQGAATSEAFLNNLPIINAGKPVTKTGPDRRPTNNHPPPKYKPTTTYANPSVTDPFPLLASSTATPPAIPAYNVPRPALHREYGLTFVPPLFIGFTRQWPMLLQCVVGYITAGWPPESIYVVENTGVQSSNKDGKLSIQNPFYLNHTTLRRLGVNVIQTPVLLTFSQMQNFFLSTAHERSWPYYFYSHQDVLVMSFEDGSDTIKRPGDRDYFFYDGHDEAEMMRPPAAGQKGYKTIYENSLRELNRTLEHEDRWAFRWFQYDHLTLVNREALDAVGGWDSLMPYYGSDCDMNARLAMDGWSMRHRRVGIINDVSTVLEDLSALYRDPKVTPRFLDPNPIPETDLRELEKEEKEQEEAAAAVAAQDASNNEKGEDDETKEIDKSAAAETPNEDDDTTQKNKKQSRQHPNRRRAPAPPTTNNDGSSSSSSSSTTTTTTKSSNAADYFRRLLAVADEMGQYKYRSDNRARNSWQNSQHGGAGEPYHYPAEGFAESFWILAEAGREVFRQKWGHRDCDLVDETALRLEDMWRVEKDWED
ncbi:hypothetical protein F4778DRAFT_743574 [Xylariomycetidae sp. FL2044]|nr:hypothetical protein F4778DRAFT_743574 [Xylariomycetidae sp. FL2044]